MVAVTQTVLQAIDERRSVAVQRWRGRLATAALAD